MDEESLFAAALQLSNPDDRVHFLRCECDDDVLRSSVQTLLACHDPDYLESPISLLGVPLPAWEESARQPLDFLDSSDYPDALGQLDEYVILEELGRGSAGIVLKALDQKLGRTVAVKLLSPTLASIDEIRKRFIREARAVAAVVHPNIVTLHCVNDDHQFPYLVMEHVGGATLEQRLAAEGPLPTMDIVRIALDVARGLAAAHEMGIVHRDIKPSNILLSLDGREATITDFGLARAIDDASLTRAGYVLGTPQFMSPEQASDGPVDGRSDLFSLGAVMHTMAVGQSPFHAKSSIVAMKRVCDETPQPIRELRDKFPSTLCWVCRTLMAKNPDDRIQSAKELVTFLEDYLHHLQKPDQNRSPRLPPAVAKTRDHYKRCTKRSARNLMLVATGLVACGLFGTGLLSITGWFRPADRQSAVPPLKKLGPDDSVPKPSSVGETKGISGSSILLTDALAGLKTGQWVWSEPENLGPAINTAGHEDSATVSADGLTLIVSSRHPDKESSDLYLSRRTSTDAEWPTPRSLGPLINTQEAELCPAISRNGRSLAFESHRDGPDKLHNVYVADWNADLNQFGKPTNLRPLVEAGRHAVMPILFDRGLSLVYFGGIKTPTNPGMHLASRTSIGSEFRSPIDYPLPRCTRWISDDRRVVFGATMKSPGSKLFVRTRASESDDFGASLEPGFQRNDRQRDTHIHPWFVPAHGLLFFSSNRPGGYGKHDIWMIKLQRAVQP